MTEDQPLVCVLEKQAFSNDFLSEAIEVVDAEIHVYGKPLRFRIGVRDWEAPMSALVPVARVICDELLNAVLDEHLFGKKETVSCQKGCAACCSYLIGLSMPEVFQMREEFSELPADDRIPILTTCVNSARKILKREKTGLDINEYTDLQQVSDWYRGLNLRCPFLKEGLCSIYDQRPLVCREYFVQSPPDWCFTGQSHHPDPEPVRLPVSVAEVLVQVAAEIEQMQEEAVILPLALIGTDEILCRSKRLWPAVEITTRFVRALEERATCTSVELCETD